MVIVTITLVINTTIIVMVRGDVNMFTFAATALAAAASLSWTKNEPESRKTFKLSECGRQHLSKSLIKLESL